MTNKEIAERATKALYMFENSKPNEISNEDLVLKVNEALRLIKMLTEEVGALDSIVGTLVKETDADTSSNK